MTGLHGRPARGQSVRRVRMPKLPDAVPRMSAWEEARTASKCSSRRSGRLGSRQNPELVKMRTSASEGHFPSLPKISATVRAASFEEILADAQRRAQHRRVQARKKSEEGGELLPFVSSTNINKNTIAGYHAFSALMRNLNQRSAGDLATLDLEAERAAEAEEKRKAEQKEVERMTRLTMLAASALTEQTDQDRTAPARRTSTVVTEEEKRLSEAQKRKREDEAIQRARLEREKDPEDVAEVLRPPDFALVIERFNWEGPGLSQKELRKAEEQFHIYKTEGQGDVHLDRVKNNMDSRPCRHCRPSLRTSLYSHGIFHKAHVRCLPGIYELLTSMFYMTIDEATIKKLVVEITPFSALEKQELFEFLRKYTQHERDYIRKVFHEFDEDGSGELNTNEVQAVLEALGCSPFRGTLQRLIDAVDADHSQTLDFNEFLSLLLVYRQTDGFSHKEIRQLYRTFCRFAVEDPHTKVKKVPSHRLTAALIFEFGAQAADLARKLAASTSKIMKGGRSPWKLAAANVRPSLGQEQGAGLTFRQFTAWSRRMKEAEIGEYVRQFKKFDQSGDGVLDRTEVKTLLAEMGYTPMRSNVDDLFEAVDMDGDSTINLEEYLDVMDYFKKWDGFTGAQAEELENLFNRHKDSSGEISSMQMLDIFRSRGVNLSLRKIQQLVAKVDVDGTHSLDFKEFLRLMRLQRETELIEAKEAFFITLKETLPPEEFNKIEDSESLTIRPEDLTIPVQILNLQTDVRELKRVVPKYTDNGRIDFDNLVGLTDELRHLRLTEHRKQASYSHEEINEFQRAFEEFDVDNSGEIDRDEMSALLKHLNLELKTKDDQKRLMNLLNAARTSAAESGVDAKQCGKMNTAVVGFLVFVHMCRLLQREKEAKALAEEEAEAARLGFTEAQTKKLHSTFCLWAAQAEDEPSDKKAKPKKEDSQFNELATLSVDSFCELLKNMNSRLSDEDLAELRKLLAALRGAEAGSEGGLLYAVTSLEMTNDPEAGVIHGDICEVSFPLFVRCLRWMVANDFSDSAEVIRL
ncbi:CML12 [Symbiodinium natans]|uniref:Calmodulin n=1 Tax=Symbiodinium natans TaxID=878477 RepID=A0A812S0V8_9DINO|nr:CML12 [Symbiodinium natans]